MKMPVFVINLENDRDSWEAVASSIRQYGQNVELQRIDATNGRTIDIRDYHDVDLDLFRKRNGREILAGEYGCYKSHLNALRSFLESGAPYGLVLEDDVLFNEHTEQRIEAIIEALPDFGAMKLVNHRHRYLISLGETQEGDLIGRTIHGPQGSAAAYLVSREGAKRLLDRLATMSLPWDVALERFWQSDTDVFSVNKDVLDFSSYRERSSIAVDGGYRTAKFSRHRRLGAAAFRFREIFDRAWNVMHEPWQSRGSYALGPTAALTPPQPVTVPSWATWLAGVVVLVFLSAVWKESDAYRYAGLVLICAALVYYLKDDFWTYNKPLIGWAGLLCIGWTIYVASRFVYVTFAYPDHGTGTAEGIYLFALFYPSFGYGLYLFIRKPFHLSIVFLTISLVVIALGADYSVPANLHAIPYLQNNSIHASVASGFIALCALPFALYALRRPDLSTAARFFSVTLALATFLAALFAIYMFLSKGVWLAMAIALPTLTIVAVFTEKARWIRWMAAAGFLLVVAGAFIARDVVQPVIENTLTVSTRLISNITSGDGILASIDKEIADPETPVSERERLMLWSNAIQLWMERPVFGNGISWQYYWKDRPYQESNYNLLHNGYLEIAVRYGVLGLAFYMFLAVWAFVRILQASRAGLVDVAVLQCYCATVSFFAATILTNSNIRLALGESFIWMAASLGFYCYFLLQRHGYIRPKTAI